MKILLLIAIIVFAVSTDAKLNREYIKRQVKNAPTSKIERTIKDIDKTRVPDLSRKTRLDKLSEVQKMDIAIDTVAKKGKNAELLLESDPLTTIRLYTKHGDGFIEVYKKTERSIMGIDLGTYEELVRIVPKDSLAKKMIKKLKIAKESDIAKRFLEVMDKTGKRGYDISKQIADYAKKYPKSSAVGAMYLWFLADPTGFESALKKSGDNIGTFASDVVGTATTVAIEVPMSVANSAGSHLVESVKKTITPVNFVFLIIPLMLWLGWRFRNRLSMFYRKAKEVIKKTRSDDKDPL